MASDRHRWAAAPPIGYAVAILFPLVITVVIAELGWPPFVFEHLIVLLVVGVAIPWGIAPAAVSGIVAVGGAQLLLREPVGRLAMADLLSVLDLMLFLAVAVVVGWLVTRARDEKKRAEDAAARERRVREDRDRLVAMVSHDLATPLTAIRGTIQFARRFGRDADVDMPRLLVRIDTAVARATSLVRTLTDVHALDNDQLSLELRPVDLRELVVPIVQMFDRVSERHPVAFAQPDAPLMVRGDAERLQRVIENLISNAFKYSPQGGAVEVSLSATEATAVLTVRDYGIGVSDEALPRIFERAYRAPEAAAAAPGLGLGLTIAAEIVRRHGGTIDMRRAEPRGSIIRLALPRLPISATVRDGRHGNVQQSQPA